MIPATLPVRIQPAMKDGDEVFATFDGQVTTNLAPGDEVRVSASDRPLRLIRPTTKPYYEVLRQKLKWGER